MQGRKYSTHRHCIGCQLFFLVLVTFTLLPSELMKGGEGRLEAWELHFPESSVDEVVV